MPSQRETRVATWRGAALVFLGISVSAIVFPALVNMTAAYYLTHPVVIPLGERVLIGVGAFVRIFRLPIIVFSGIVLIVISLIKAR